MHQSRAGLDRLQELYCPDELDSSVLSPPPFQIGEVQTIAIPPKLVTQHAYNFGKDGI